MSPRAAAAAFEAELGRAIDPASVEITGTAFPAYHLSPSSTGEICDVVAACRQHRVPLHPVGLGGRPSHAPEDRPRVLLTTRRLDQVLLLDETSLLVEAQAGLGGLELERALARRGLSLGDYPPAVLASTIGGILAVRTPGKSSARHGFFEDAVVSVSAVLANGRLVHTRMAPRRSTGPDLSRALCGSEGTLGIITSAVLRIHPKPEARFLCAYLLPSVDVAVSAVLLALREEAMPSGMRIYDSEEAAAHFDGLVLPEGQALLVAATAGPTDLAACDRDLLSSAVHAEGGGETDLGLAEAWWRRLHGNEPTLAPAPALQVMARSSKLRGIYAAVRASAQTLGAAARAHLSRFDLDGGVMFFTFTRDGHVLSGLEAGQVLATCAGAADAAGGWLLGARAAKLDSYLLALKRALDPDELMNPGVLG
ncbi:MAG: FAD-binding oxidoreductase [Kofleriaceae bacterium]